MCPNTKAAPAVPRRPKRLTALGTAYPASARSLGYTPSPASPRPTTRSSAPRSHSPSSGWLPCDVTLCADGSSSPATRTSAHGQGSVNRPSRRGCALSATPAPSPWCGEVAAPRTGDASGPTSGNSSCPILPCGARQTLPCHAAKSEGNSSVRKPGLFRVWHGPTKAVTQLRHFFPGYVAAASSLSARARVRIDAAAGGER